jgi:hypothetical protein
MFSFSRLSAACCCLALSISGATLTYNSGTLGTISLSGSGNLQFQLAGQSQFNWAAPQFDPSLGTLIRTTGTVVVTLNGTSTIQNPNVAGQPGSDPMQLTLGITAAPFFLVDQGGTLVAPFDLNQYSNNQPLGYDVNLSGNPLSPNLPLAAINAGSTQVTDVTGTRSFTASLTNQSNGVTSGLWCFICPQPTLAHPFIGTGTVNVQVANLRSFLGLTSGSPFFTAPNSSFAGNFQISMQLTHEYTPNASAIPEPGTWMMMGSAVVLLGAARRFRRTGSRT